MKLVKEAKQQLQQWEEKMSAYTLALGTMGFDEATVAPKGGNRYRASRMAILSGEYYSLLVDPEIGDVLQYLSKVKGLDAETKRIVLWHLKQRKDTAAIPKKEYVAYQELLSLSMQAWEKAKKAKKYAIFEPYLHQIVETQKRFAKYRDPKKDAYDLYLDDFEEGMSKKDYDAFFQSLRKELVPLIHQVQKSKHPVDTSFLNGKFKEKDQRKAADLLKKYMGFNSSWGYMSVSMHPFTQPLSNNDVRITTNFSEEDFSDNLFSIIHEVGHAKHAHGTPAKYFDNPLGAFSCAECESQSRLYENMLGRSMAFWDCNYPKLQRIFPQLKPVSQKAFVQAVNAVRNTPIRCSADELTYPIHIMIRYEIEKGLFSGKYTTKGLDKVWNKMMKEQLGIVVKNDAEGILQDIHWSQGSFGYFPTYALGSAYAAQFFHAMSKSVKIDQALQQNKLAKVDTWLVNHFYRYGNLRDPMASLKKATGENFQVKYYTQYLKKKYRQLYRLK